MKYQIRNYHITDLSSLYRICLLTGHNGDDASPFLKDTDLVGHLFAAPYAIFEPELCFILLKNYTPSGYVLGTKNSIKFYEQCEKNWYPELRIRYPMPPKNNMSLESNFIRYLHQNQVLPEGLENYPAHLHIDLLPIAQGEGNGRKLIEAFLTKLQSQNVQGVHLTVSKNNQNAIGFYSHVGFQKLKELEESIIFVKNL